MTLATLLLALHSSLLFCEGKMLNEMIFKMLCI